VVEESKKSAGHSEAEMILSGINNYCASASMKAQLNNDESLDICADGVTIEEVSKMVNLGDAKVTKVTYTNKVTELVVESNGYTFTLQPNGSFDNYEGSTEGNILTYKNYYVNYGGLYMDSDVEVLSNLDDFLYNNCFFGFESSISCTALFGAEKNNGFIKKLLDYYDEKAFVDECGVYDMTPNSTIWFDFLKSVGFKANGEYQHMNGITLYPEKVLSGKSVLTKHISMTKDTKAIHHFSGSWVDKSNDNILKSMQWEYE